MQKFHSKMTPRSLYTQFHLTEITYAKVCTMHCVLCISAMYCGSCTLHCVLCISTMYQVSCTMREVFLEHHDTSDQSHCLIDLY